MTFSLIARCATTGAFGYAAATSNIGVGARLCALAAGVGGVLTQHRTDPRLAPRGVALLQSGCDARHTIAALVASTPDHGWRQLAAIDAQGGTAHFHGERVKPARGAAHGPDVVAIGNILANDQVPDAMVAAFQGAGGALADRLLVALAAGEAAGGEHGPVVSAALRIVTDQDFPYADLRVDRAADPITTLAGLWADYAPWADEFVLRALTPDAARGG
ncbi:putative Ntn-hydrolase superfamily protein [Humitalea rosea]|uniref:Putative Ntn-hydrolase superfamily protein n=1 Tax=Humitalea rosea TaxID=990373 RepID=A0A2W7J8P2_9PROT|nr:DUF1028 domain-containing protein [Humitalea rosea]PZW48143.1 putative Ntn-hydrolase superfamily protein [Humitalea rosea]